MDPWHRYSNEAERANSDIRDDFKFKKTLYPKCLFFNLKSSQMSELALSASLEYLWFMQNMSAL